MKYFRSSVIALAASGLSFAFASQALAQTTMRMSISTAQNSHQGVAI
ncbi:MAG: hypothetical protein V7642_6006, partial [Burkholderiales bacterium]